ncbi:glycoside hydrolase [Paenibacillus swuensis]|uniref:Glycoside hydrolase n=1 Tax=Paenibacillus swuensis TaxID=1178515 RepID=A0A172TIW5_9BACL|nr:beta-N-acetylhexosaminidase [Paenibacillus swuensis]ANE46950.1 glycoside hydrolase [Paenibacillus swuensis]
MKVSALTLEEKVGQLFMVGFQGTKVTDEVRTMLEKYHVGGIIYFRRNVGELEEIAALSSDLQRIGGKELPLLIAIDQEGGMVSRIDREVTLIPGAMALGAARDADAVYETARISGRELRELGINMNFAPSVDVNNNPLNPVIGIRSYGEEPELVGELGAAASAGYQEAGVAATLKHFPGHGDTDVDSHLGLGLVPHDADRLEAVELLPFVRCMEAGVDAVMTAHVVFPAYEPNGVPATLSHSVITELLRNKLGYDGVIVTDCLEMHAISKEYGIPQGAVMAVEAGADLVLVSHTFAEQAAAVEAVTAAVRAGRISEARIDASVGRVLALKAKRGMASGAAAGSAARGAIGAPADWDVVRRVSERSITLVKDEGQLPLSAGERTLVVWAEPRESTEVIEIIEQDVTLGTALSAYVADVREMRIGLDPASSEIDAVLAAAEGCAQVVVATHNPVARLGAGQVRLVEALAAREGVKLVVASTRNPYDLMEFPQVKTYLCAYENRPMAMQSLAKVLVGRIPAQGRLPVTLSEAYPFGWPTAQAATT